MDDLSRDEIEYALKVARARGYTSVKLKSGETSFSAVLGESEFDEVEEASDVTANPKQVSIKSPSVGYFRPGRAALAVGHTVSQGDVVGEVVALGIVNDITASGSGKVAEIHVEDGEAVEFGQVVFTLEAE